MTDLFQLLPDATVLAILFGLGAFLASVGLPCAMVAARRDADEMVSLILCTLGAATAILRGALGVVAFARTGFVLPEDAAPTLRVARGFQLAGWLCVAAALLYTCAWEVARI